MLSTKTHWSTPTSSYPIPKPQPHPTHIRQSFLPAIDPSTTITLLQPHDPPVTTSAQPSPTSHTHEINDTLSSILGKHTTQRSEHRPQLSTKKVKWTEEWSYHTYLPESTTPTTSLPENPGYTNPTAQTNTKSTPPKPTTKDKQGLPPDPLASLSALDEIHTQVVHWPHNLIPIVKNIIATKLLAPSVPDFEFSLTREAALKNFCILLRHQGDLGKAIQHQHTSPVGYGSEFRPVKILEPLLRLHPYWPKVKSLLTQGSIWPLHEISEEGWQEDVREALEFGNHKQAQLYPELLTSLIVDDVTNGFALPLPLEKITRIKGILIAPMNIASQDTIDEHGNSTPKKRLTHDQSYIFNGTGTSVNSRVDKTSLTPCIFGWAIRRLAHWIVSARLKYPNTIIYATKLDFKSAYRRCHMHASTAVQSCAILPALQIALLMLRLTFGGTPCPYEWSTISELICNLATAIVTDEEWDPSLTHSPDHHLIPPHDFLPDDIPFGQGKELIVDVNINDRGTHDMYIDDIIGLGIDLPHTNNRLRSEQAPLLAMHTCARPIHEAEPIPRQDMASKNKLKAEARLSEIKTILGWTWDLRHLIISLPENKYIAWSGDIQTAVSSRRTMTTKLESTIGRLTHLSLVVPHVHHFLSRIWELHTTARRANLRHIHFTDIIIDDLNLMRSFLDRAYRGIDMNLITYRQPTHVYRSDSCPAGIGGYNHQGFAWCYYFPEDLLFRASNNLLEHHGWISSREDYPREIAHCP
jgi:hypothetical protein